MVPGAGRTGAPVAGRVVVPPVVGAPGVTGRATGRAGVFVLGLVPAGVLADAGRLALGVAGAAGGAGGVAGVAAAGRLVAVGKVGRSGAPERPAVPDDRPPVE